MTISIYNTNICVNFNSFYNFLCFIHPKYPQIRIACPKGMLRYSVM